LSAQSKRWLPPRAAAASALKRVMQGHSTNSASSELNQCAPEERARAQALLYAALRNYGVGTQLQAALLKSPLKPSLSWLKALIEIALAELMLLKTPAHAAVHETVAAARTQGMQAYTGLLNALLRRFLREREQLLAQVMTNESARLRHPSWLIEAIRKVDPEQVESWCAENLKQAPMSLRVNLRQLARSAWLEHWQSKHQTIAHGSVTPEAVVLDEPVNVLELPGFNDGHCSVQDLAAMQVAHVLELKPGDRVLDACAAPGGKAAHLLERHPGIELVALDLDGERLQRVSGTLKRLKLSAVVKQADAIAYGQSADTLFDCVLLDAPCSGTGVIRRHPDILWLRRADDIGVLAKTQSALLDALWLRTKKGGCLLYSTCSILPAENQDQILAFLSRHPDARLKPFSTPEGFSKDTGYGRFNAPGEMQGDGFFIALIERVGTSAQLC
jgi:16S rRNA (cytosine967-C5)-methyltransferase